MSTQITVRLPDDLVVFIDDLVHEGVVPSRAAAVATALERERRRHIAQRDADILSAAGEDSDMDSLARHGANVAMPELA